jgi:hypothetical protein
MSDLIKRLLTNPNDAAVIREKLPPAFQAVENELKGNPAVGLLREQVIIGMLIAFLGKENIEIIESGVNPDVDCYVGKDPLSIKTVSNSGSIRIKWTSNALKAKEFMRSYEPKCDLLVIRIAWEAAGSITMIPVDVQRNIFTQIGINKYLDYRGSTNTRGVNLTHEVESKITKNSNVTRLDIFWKKSDQIINPIDRWIDYWSMENK